MKLKETMPIISIIVPVYKVEKYLRRCIDSILSQTFVNFECILIDDESPDDSGKICDEYAEKDSRIIVIHQKNAGVSAARNAGLDIAKGEWLGFVDSDDWCDPDMFQVLYDNAIKYNSDISICGYRIIDTSNKIKTTIKCSRKIQILNKEEAISGIFLLRCFGGYSWNKLVKSDIFIQSKLRYDPKITYMQDVLLFYELFKYIKKAVYLPMPYYNYFYNSESTTNLYGLTAKAKTAFMMLDGLISSEKNKKIKKKILISKMKYSTSLCYHYLNRYDFVNDDFSYLRKSIAQNINILLFDFSVSFKQKIMSCLVLTPRLYTCLFRIWKYFA
jgi:glycosyltransferase involved in cell wall biosynthesis